MAEASDKKLCCTSSGSLCFWFAAFFIFYGLGMTAIFTMHVGRYQGAVLFVALGLACVVNLVRNRTFHCAITAPFFLLVAAALALQTAGIWSLSMRILWPIVLIVVGIAFLLEKRFAS